MAKTEDDMRELPNGDAIHVGSLTEEVSGYGNVGRSLSLRVGE